MKVAIVGYGKMGKVIEQILLSRGHDVVAKATKNDPLTKEMVQQADVAIEFSTPSAVLHNIRFLVQHNIPMVVGTTGWQDAVHEVTEEVKKSNGSLVYSSNFSIGVNLFFAVNEFLARKMALHQEYTPEITEIHHTEKLDAPSGTAISLANGIINEYPGLSDWYCPEGTKKTVSPSALKITAIREPEVKGTHRIDYHSVVDNISIQHEAHSREGFALGAVIASEWIQDKKGIFTMKDVLQLS